MGQQSVGQQSVGQLSIGELKRLEALWAYQILDTPAEPQFDDLTQLAAKFCQMPIALISLLDTDRQWFKSKVGISASATCRSIAFCHHTIQSDAPLVVEDARQDRRFAHNPLVTGEPFIRFYAGVPLITPEGHRIGTLCVIDQVPRTVTPEQLSALEALGRQTVCQLELRRSRRSFLEREKYLQAIIRTEPDCVKLLDSDGILLDMNPAGLTMLEAHRDTLIGQSIYPHIAPEHRQAFDVFNRQVCSGRPGRLEFDVITCLGNRRCVESHAVPLTEPNGRTVHLAITRDVTAQKKAQQERRSILKNLADLKFALDQSAIVAVTDENGVILDVNDKFCQISQYSKAELIGKTHDMVSSGHHGQQFFEKIYRTIAGGDVWHGEIKNRAKDGSFYWMDTTIVPVLDFQQIPCQYIAICSDITERKQAEMALIQQREREQLVAGIAQRIRKSLDLSEILDTTVAEVRHLLQADRVITYRMAADGTGQITAEAVAPGCQTIAAEASLPAQVFSLGGHRRYRQGRIRRVNNINQDPLSPDLRQILQQIGVQSQLVVPILHGDDWWGLLIVHQCSHARSWQAWESQLLQRLATQVAIAVHQASLYQRLLREARYDGLTGLLNRSALMGQLERALSQFKHQGGQPFALLFLDLDHFKIINDSLGHLIGDQLLVKIAHVLDRMVAAPDFVARLGGDEFVIFIQSADPMGQAVALAEHICQYLNQPIDIEDHELVVTASIGISPVNTTYDSALDLLRDADISMYRAKTNGKNRHEIFVPAMRQGMQKRLNLETDLRRALGRQELSLRYQPIVALDSQAITGFEALLRWEHPVQGFIASDEFIPIAEESGLVVPLGLWVIETACRQMALWQEKMPRQQPLSISVNLSALQLRNPALVDQIQVILEANQLSPQQLILEVTESLLIEDAPSAIDLLRQLRSQGVQISLDDFGTGYSSLGYLHRMPVDILKIDKTFISSASDPSCRQDIITTIIDLSHHLGLEVIAEGIETFEQMIELTQLGCQMGQGYFFSKPLVPEAIDLLL